MHIVEAQTATETYSTYGQSGMDKDLLGPLFPMGPRFSSRSVLGTASSLHSRPFAVHFACIRGCPSSRPLALLKRAP